MSTRKYAILILKYQKFSGEGAPDPSPYGEGDTPSPHPTPLRAFGASIRLAPSALGTALFSTPNASYGSVLQTGLLRVWHF